MEPLHHSSAPPRAVTLITFAIALMGAIVMSLPPRETPLQATGATEASRSTSHPRKAVHGAASADDASASPAPADCENA